MRIRHFVHLVVLVAVLATHWPIVAAPSQPAAEVARQALTAPAAASVSSPLSLQLADTAVIPGGAVTLVGQLDDPPQVTQVWINGQPAEVLGDTYRATVTVAPDAPVVHVITQDTTGQFRITSQVLRVDGDGPQIVIQQPKTGQSVYTLRPTVAISYTDHLTAVNPATVQAVLTDGHGTPTDITADLTITDREANGQVSFDLTEDAVYTLTVTLQDTLGNASSAQTVFYVPQNANEIPPPNAAPTSGWVNGVIYNSETCNSHLTNCQGLSGARITVAMLVNAYTLFLPLVIKGQSGAGVVTQGIRPEYPTPPSATGPQVVQVISGTIVTGPDGFYAFPLPATGHYWLRVEKDGYTYGQREFDGVAEKSTAINALYLTPMDTAVTPCDVAGCTHTTSDGKIQLEIPPGAVAAGEVISANATNFKQVEFLPSGDLPEGTWETYAYNLGGDSEAAFEKPFVIRVQNDKGFSAGTQVPLGYWNSTTQEWEHAGTGTVEPTGTWIVMTATHFSNYDCNDPVAQPKIDVGIGGDGSQNTDGPGSQKEHDPCGENGCFISYKSGTLQEWIDLPTVNVLGEATAPQLRYSTDRANPSEVIDIRLDIGDLSGVEIGDYIGFELYIEGEKTDSFSIAADLTAAGEVGRYRYLWNGRNAQGERLPPGAYEYEAKFSIPYRGQYCYALNGVFGNPPDCVNGATGVFVDAVKEEWVKGTVTLDGGEAGAFGAGWTLDDWQRLYEAENGAILIADGQRHDEFYFPQKNKLGDTGATMPTTPTQRLARAVQTTPLDLPDDAYWDALYTRVSTPPFEIPTRATSPMSQTVCGDIVSDTVWTSEVGTYLTTCDITVEAGATLTIEPGVTVLLDYGDDLVVYGDLQAEGTTSEPIAFRLAPESSSWGHIVFKQGGRGILDYALVEQSYTKGSLYISSDQVEVLNSIIINGKTGVYIDNASPLISGTHILSNTGSSFGGGIYSKGKNPIIQSCFLANNHTSASGGAFYTHSGNPSLVSNVFANNSAAFGSDGGGIYIHYQGQVTIQDNAFLHNTESAIHISEGEAFIEHNLFEGNTGGWAGANMGYGTWGGGIFNDDGNATIIRNILRNNSADDLGGGIFNVDGDAVIRNNIIVSNTAESGGGIYNMRGEVVVENNYILSNTAETGAGIAANTTSSRFIVRNNLIRDNQATQGPGGGFYSNRGEHILENNTFSHNSASTNGGAIYNSTATMLVQNNTIYSNTANTGGGLYNYYASADISIANNQIFHNYARNTTAGDGIHFNQTAQPTLDYNNVWNNGDRDYYNVQPGEHDIAVDPLFVDLAGGDFHLTEDSPCIDAGDPDTYAFSDFEGDPRPMGGAPDIGVDEALTPYAYSRTATDYSWLEYDSVSGTYTRFYPDGTRVHFNANGTHDFTRAPDGRKTVYVYAADGALSSIGIAPPGESAPRWTWTLAYTFGALATITDPAGRVTRFTVDAQGHLVETTTPDNAIRAFTYNADHLLTFQTDQNNAVASYKYDAQGRITQVIEPLRQVYDPATGQTTFAQETRAFTPSDTGYPLINASSVGDPDTPAPAVPMSADLVDRVDYGRGGQTGHTDRWGFWLDSTDALSRTTAYQRDKAGNILRVDYANGDCAEYTYNEVGHILTEDRMGAAQCALAPADRAPAQVQHWAYTYEPRFYYLKTATDPLSQTVTYVYDYEEGRGEAGNLIRIEYPAIQTAAGPVSLKRAYTYNALGLLVSMTDVDGRTTQYTYTLGTADEAYGGATPLFAAGVTPVPGMLKQIIEDAGASPHLNLTTTFKDFDAAGLPGTTVTPRGAVYTYTYDTLGRVTAWGNDLGSVTHYAYDGRGNVISQTVGVGTRDRVSTYNYDAQDRLLSAQTQADGMAWGATNAYDINGQLARQADAQGRAVVYTYDVADQLVGLTDPLSHTTTYSYTLKGEPAGITDPNDNSITLAYDGQGNLAAVTPPDQPTHAFSYTLNGLVETYTPPDVGGGDTGTRYTYNALQQLTQVTRPDGETLTYTYNGAGQLDSITLGTGELLYSYHATTQQLTGIEAPSGVDLTYGYDRDVISRTTWTGPVKGVVSAVIDGYYRMTAQTVNTHTVPFAYTADHVLTQAGDLQFTYYPQSALPAGSTLGAVADAWGYNAYGEAISYTASVSATAIYATRYTYDALARIAGKTETVAGSTQTYTYTYDATGRLTHVYQDGVQIDVYTYDANGNRLTHTTPTSVTTGAYDAQDRLTQSGETRYTYTANGELLTKARGALTTTYTYDALGNLLGVTQSDGTAIAYLVDGENRRVGKKVNGALVQGFLYQDALNPVAELDGNNQIVSRFVYGSRFNVPDYMVRDGATYRLISDHLGSVRLVVHTETGAIAQRLDYDAFGQVLMDTNPGFQPFGFAGGLYDPDTGLVRFGARDYDAEVGRWTAKDPIGFNSGNTNFYTYVANDPINRYDPWGLIDWVKGAKIAKATAGAIGNFSGMVAGIAFALGTGVTGVGFFAGAAYAGYNLYGFMANVDELSYLLLGGEEPHSEGSMLKDFAKIIEPCRGGITDIAHAADLVIGLGAARRLPQYAIGKIVDFIAKVDSYIGIGKSLRESALEYRKIMIYHK